MSSYFRGVLAALIVATGASAASAQQVEPAAPAAPPVVVRWNNGLSIESPDGNDKLQFGADIQSDGRFDLSTPAAITDTFLLRRARLLVQGRTSKYFEFYFLPDFANSTIVLFDAYVDTKFSSAFRIRSGKGKSPVGLEQLYSDGSLPLPERSLGNNLVPNRDIGVTALGDLAHGHVSYIAGVQNGVADAANVDTDANGGKDLVGRATVKLGFFGVAVGGSHGQETGALPSYKSTAQQTFFSYGTGVTANGAHNRVSPSAFVYYKALGGFAEYFHNTQDISKGSTTANLKTTGWNVTGLVALTGDAVSERGITPHRPFDPAKHQWGALQVAARVSSLTVDPQAFSLGWAASGANSTAKAVGVALDWFNTPIVKHVLSYERTVFDHDPNGPRKAEHALVYRVQIYISPSL
jgi:phosphate-selective porin OprO/OprP